MCKKWEIALEVFSGSSEAHAEFREAFSAEIDEFIERFYDAYKTYHDIPDDIRIRGFGFSEYFAFNALNCLLISMNLLISGLPAPSGGLMRTYCESLAWAIFCSSRRLTYAYELEKIKGKFDGQKGINHLNKEENIKELSLNEAGNVTWAVFIIWI